MADNTPTPVTGADDVALAIHASPSYGATDSRAGAGTGAGAGAGAGTGAGAATGRSGGSKLPLKRSASGGDGMRVAQPQRKSLNDARLAMPPVPKFPPRAVSAPAGRASARRRPPNRSSWGAVWAAVKFKAMGAVETFECPLCLSNERVDTAYTVVGCDHMMCRECVAEYITAEVSEAHVLDLHCPGADGDGGACGTRFTGHDVEELVSAEVYDKYSRFVKTQKDTTIRECPNEACRHLQKGNPRWPAMTCEKCGKKYCYAHSLAHPGVTCRQYLASRAQENKLNNQFIQRHSVKCPNPTCGLPVSKTGGCNHMTCGRCRTEFCYLCGNLCLLNSAIHYAKFNPWGCPDRQFSGGPEAAGSRRRFYLWRVVIFPIIALIMLGLASPFVGIALGVWAGCFFGLCVLWCPALVIYACRKGRFSEDVAIRLCCGPIVCCGVLLAAMEPLCVPLTEIGSCLTYLFCWCTCCPRRR